MWPLVIALATLASYRDHHVLDLFYSAVSSTAGCNEGSCGLDVVEEQVLVVLVVIELLSDCFSACHIDLEWEGRGSYLLRKRKHYVRYFARAIALGARPAQPSA